ncbi:MAG: hypothetical protein NT126_06420 [Bacteroidetes bacterium]|nr:hypothetical protein [Bacteroidota bacterium]
MIKIIGAITFSILLISPVYAQTDSTTPDSLLLQEIQKQLTQENNAVTNAPAPRSAPSANPDISVIGDFRGSYQSNHSRNFDANLHETEISLQSTVDPYAKADFFISITRDPVTGEFKSEIEEGYLTTLSLPAHLQLKAGKFKQALGRINPVHPHALAFVDMPNAFVRFFGEEGMNDEGLQLSWLLPNQAFFQELTVEVTDGPRDSPGFARSSKNNYLKLAHLKNFWDLTANATLELGLTGISGANFTDHQTNVGAADLTYKWKPVKYNTYKSFTFQNEIYFSHAQFDSLTVNSIGLYSLMNLQVSKRWFVTARYDYTNKPSSVQFVEQAASTTFGWYATEFQKIELQGKATFANQPDALNNYEKNFTQIFLRWIFVIGTHGAHQY